MPNTFSCLACGATLSRMFDVRIIVDDEVVVTPASVCNDTCLQNGRERARLNEQIADVRTDPKLASYVEVVERMCTVRIPAH